jgi:hypothetical protein
MEKRRHLLSGLYAAIGLAAAIGIWSCVGSFLGGADPTLAGMMRQMTASPISTMLAIEMFCIALAASVFMWVEAKRIGLGRRGLTLFLAVTAGFGVVVPLFLAWRERRLRSAVRAK